MKMRFPLLAALLVLFVTSRLQAQTQPCGTDEATRQLFEKNPVVKQFVDEYNRQIKEGLIHFDLKNARKTSGDATSDTFWYDVPVVVHIVHDYNNNQEYLSDDSIFNSIENWNLVYAGANHDTGMVIAPFKKWVGIPRIRLHLATIDPYGNPTKGITRHRSYLTYIGGDQSKLDDWPRASYINIWVVNSMSLSHASAAAYAYMPDGANLIPFWDGVICLYNYFGNYTSGTCISKTINHELGHVLNLYHTFGQSNTAPNPVCGDDEVDDTPPTHGHLFNCCTAGALYDTACATNYYKLYLSASGGDSLVDYPDTVNAQNIMDYTYCMNMFTKGQAARMHDALNNTLAERNNLWDIANLVFTGALAPRPDLQPIPEFAAIPKTGSDMKYFTCANSTGKFGACVRFINESWNDTISFVRWQFSNNAAIPDIQTNAKTPVTNSFREPGWVTLTMTATDTSGANIGRANNVGMRTFPNAVFVADSFGTSGKGFYEEFNPSGDLAKWPTFNYYNNEFKWAPCSNAGYYDSYSMSYIGFDSRIDPVHFIYPVTGTPSGDFDDLYSIPFDLTAFAPEDSCNLNFYYSGASRSSVGTNVNDSLVIQYSIDSSKTWNNLYTMKKGVLASRGAVDTFYVPSGQSDWSPMSISLPADSRNLRSSYVIFRFRYFPGIGSDEFSSGNNFYLDRINFSSYPAEVSNFNMQGVEVAIAPNPTQGNAYVIISNNVNQIQNAKVEVMDITGNIVFTTQCQISEKDTHIEIPKSVIGVKGIYIIKTITGIYTNIQKLVVN